MQSGFPFLHFLQICAVLLRLLKKGRKFDMTVLFTPCSNVTYSSQTECMVPDVPSRDISLIRLLFKRLKNKQQQKWKRN